MGVYLTSLLKAILPLIIPTAILVCIGWMVISVLKQLDRIESLLSEIRDRLPELENARARAEISIWLLS